MNVNRLTTRGQDWPTPLASQKTSHRACPVTDVEKKLSFTQSVSA